ncbi:MAG: ABC transporter permease [Lachnospiraceae bacterium]|nr:ABC transporter permease [Lachnospiraceae bacterium]
MIFSILKKDLKRKKTMNIILLLFVVLATMFVASSVNNIVTVINGTDYYFDQAGIGDYIFITMGENAIGAADKVLENETAVKEYRLENVAFGSQDNFTLENGEKVILKNATILQSLADAKLNFFDDNNEVVKEVAPGKAYISRKTMEDNNLKVGDVIHFKQGDVELALEVAGGVKDALLGSTFMGNARFLLSEEDYAILTADEMISKYYSGQIGYIDTDDTASVQEAVSEIPGIALNGDRALIRMCYVMDMVIAGVLIVLSICLIIVAFVVLKFTITFTLSEEFREIGVMKAIGIKNRKIRGIYLIKYFAIASISAVIGFFCSIPFGNMLMKSISKNMVLGNNNGILLNIISSILVVGIIVLYAYRCTGKLKKYSPLDAIRSGQTGERYKKKSKLRIGKSKLRTTSFMAWNDVLSSPKRYLTIILAFMICSLLVFMIVNTTETMKSDKLVYTFGKECDAYYVNNTKAMSAMRGEGKESIEACLDEFTTQLAEHGMEVKASVDVQIKYPAVFDGKNHMLTCTQGVRTKTTDYKYYEGDAPRNAQEIAITQRISDITGAKIGDTISITISGKTDDYLVVGYFETMNNIGELVRLHEDVNIDMKDAGSMMAFGFDFVDQPANSVIKERVEEMKDIFDTEEVFTASEYSADCIGVVDTMESVGYLLLGITIIVVVLVTILMERSFISDEKGEIAILKAIGFKDASIVTWHMKRFVIVSIAAILLAIALSVPMTHLCITPIFKMMGMRQVSYVIQPVKVFLLYPGVILGVMLISSLLTALYTKKIKSSDTASIE